MVSEERISGRKEIFHLSFDIFHLPFKPWVLSLKEAVKCSAEGERHCELQ